MHDTINERINRGFLSDTAEGRAQMLAAKTEVMVCVLRPAYEAFTVASEPRCYSCGWKDGCIDDENGAVHTTWFPVSNHSFLCAGCVNRKLHGPQTDDDSIPF